MISIIIPTYNEERCLPRLLESIKRQSYSDYELIVADAGSEDRTVPIARKFGAKIVKGGKPAVGRNNGAKAARGDLLFFFDADIKLPKEFLAKASNEMEKTLMDLATCKVKPISSLLVDKVLHEFANLYIRLSQSIDPHAPGSCLLVSRRLHRRIGGFDESLKLGEDHDYVSRAAKFRQLYILKSTRVFIDVRRFAKEGRKALLGKYIRFELYRALGKDQEIEYTFGDFGRKAKNDPLVGLETWLRTANKRIGSLRSGRELRRQRKELLRKLKTFLRKRG